MATPQVPSFTAPAQVYKFRGILSDFDGTIIDSTDAIIKHWHKLGAELGVDPITILADSHGRRSIDTLKLYDESKANWDYVSEVEGRIPRDFGQDAVEIPGARDLIASLDRLGVPWAVVTSGSNALVSGWISVMKLAQPENIVVAEDVDVGKPDPVCYLLGRKRLGLEGQTDLLVLEDAPSGVKAGKAAGFKVVGLATTHTVEQIKVAGADWIVKDLSSLTLKGYTDGVADIEIKNALVDDSH